VKTPTANKAAIIIIMRRKREVEIDGRKYIVPYYAKEEWQ
jgi:hypothetical protein